MFAHGQKELRVPTDPLPEKFFLTDDADQSVHPKFVGKSSLGAVHSNYKTQPCKNM